MVVAVVAGGVVGWNTHNIDQVKAARKASHKVSCVYFQDDWNALHKVILNATSPLKPVPGAGRALVMTIESRNAAYAGERVSDLLTLGVRPVC